VTPPDGSLQELEAEPSLTDRARKSIREAIIDGQLAPGSLHSVQSLADVFKVSRTPVREALIDLASDGMVSFERNRGVRILETSVHDLEEILAIRILLEVPAAHRAASLVTPEVLNAIRSELDQMIVASEKNDESTTMLHDRRFHILINQASGNNRLADYVDKLRDQILTRGVSTVGRSRPLAAVVEQHTAILERLEARDPEGAAASMKQHLSNTGALLLKQEGGRDLDTGLGWDELVVG
jgi:DNA-binding GntR family transcriptional regulator